MRVMKTRVKSPKKRIPTRKRRSTKEARATYSIARVPIHTSLELVTLEEAALAVGKTSHNIRDYIQRGRIAKYNTDGKHIARAQNG